jgi:phosphoribosylanthranilate isomerase
LSWFLAGGLTPDNVFDAVQRFKPDGIDLSSGVERSPGDKDLAKVKQLFQRLL